MPRPAGPGHTEVLCSRAQSLALSRGRGLRRLFVADGPFRMVLNIRHRTSKSGHLHEARTMPRGWPWGQGTAEPARCAGRGRAPRALVDALSRARLLRRRRGDGRSRWDDGPPRRTRQAQSSRGAGPAWLQLNVGPRTQDLPLLDRFDASRSPGVFDDRLQNTRVFPEAPAGQGRWPGTARASVDALSRARLPSVTMHVSCSTGRRGGAWGRSILSGGLHSEERRQAAALQGAPGRLASRQAARLADR